MPTRVFSISDGPARVHQFIAIKQQGACRCCGKKFTADDEVVSNGKRRKYYHIECAQKLNIITFLTKDSIPGKLRILIVDDEPDIVQLYKRFLEEYGYEVEAFVDPQDALLNYKPSNYDIILLDIRMPGMNGFELYRAMMEREKNHRPKVCFVTAYSELTEFRKYVPELNDDYFVRKPVTANHLYERISILV